MICNTKKEKLGQVHTTCQRCPSEFLKILENVAKFSGCDQSSRTRKFFINGPILVMKVSFCSVNTQVAVYNTKTAVNVNVKKVYI